MSGKGAYREEAVASADGPAPSAGHLPPNLASDRDQRAFSACHRRRKQRDWQERDVKADHDPWAARCHGAKATSYEKQAHLQRDPCRACVLGWAVYDIDAPQIVP